jgi:hypothetical protein
MQTTRVLTLLSLLIAAPAWPQTHHHSGPTQGMDTAPRAVPGDLAGLLEAGDQSLRTIERAVEREGPRTVGELALRFMSVTELLGDYFDTDEPRPAKEITRARKALERHVRVLGELADRASSPEAREPLDAAHDASLRTLEAVEAAALAAAPAQSGGHHGSSSGNRCGHR